MEAPPIKSFSKYLNSFIQAAAAAASIFAFIKIEEMVPNDYAGMIYAGFLVALTFALAIYIFIIHSRKLHRYADIPPFLHHVNHTVRSMLTRTRQRMANGTLTHEDIEEIELATISMLDSIAHCFSILTGCQCGVCIKELQHGEQPRLRTVYRDSLSQHSRGGNDANQDPHPIETDTPCWEIFTGQVGCERGYLCNNVKLEWYRGKYKSPSFERNGGEPHSINFLGLKLIRGWNIRYKSAFVSPIRYRAYLRNGGNLPRPSVSTPSPTVRYWGFLCVDGNKRNLFSEDRHRDVLAAFSDALFIYFNELHDIIDRYTKQQL